MNCSLSSCSVCYNDTCKITPKLNHGSAASFIIKIVQTKLLSLKSEAFPFFSLTRQLEEFEKA